MPHEVSDPARRYLSLHVVGGVLQLQTMQLDDIQAIAAVCSLICSFLSQRWVDAALQVQDSLVLVEAELLLLSYGLQQVLHVTD